MNILLLKNLDYVRCCVRSKEVTDGEKGGEGQNSAGRLDGGSEMKNK